MATEISNSATVDASSRERYRHRLEDVEALGRQACELSVCRDSLPYWIDAYVYTLDPMRRLGHSLVPFDLFPRQRELLAWLAEREARQEDGLIEKSRDMGASWLCCLYALHGWLFRSGFAAGFGSRKLEYVDEKGNPKSIFEKFRIVLRGLPAWMMPAGFKWKAHDCFAKLINPHNGSTITGEGGDSIGRGDRASVYFVDEAAFLERPQLVESSLSQTTNVRIDVSTPNGPGNAFAKKRFGGMLPVFTLHWRDDPRKDQAWYERQKTRFDSVTVAQEIDIDYQASIEGICIPGEWVRAAVGLHLWAKSEKGLDFPQTAEPIAGLDVAEEGKNKNVFIARRGVVVAAPLSWSQCNTTETAWRAREEALHAGVKLVNFDATAVGAGVKATWKTAEGGVPFKAVAIQSGGSPTEARWPDGKTSKEKFLNYRAEMWWSLRVRFEKAFEFRMKGVLHPVEEMVSIPDDPTLIAQLSQPQKEYTATGKLKVESKDDMRSRGIASPDFADALAYCFAPSGKWKLSAGMFYL